jgi:DNA-binding response OmpR family regulator
MAVLLIVADDRLRNDCFETLHDARFRVTALASEDEARRYLRSFTPSAIVYRAADDGDDTRRFLYDLSVTESGPQVPVVVLSGSTGATAIAQRFAYTILDGAVDFTRLCAELVRVAPQSRRARVG